MLCLCPQTCLHLSQMGFIKKLKPWLLFFVVDKFLFKWTYHGFLQLEVGTCMSKCSIQVVIGKKRSHENERYCKETSTMNIAGLLINSLHYANWMFIACDQKPNFFIKGWSVSWLIILAGKTIKRKLQNCWEISNTTIMWTTCYALPGPVLETRAIIS